MFLIYLIVQLIGKFQSVSFCSLNINKFDSRPFFKIWIDNGKEKCLILFAVDTSFWIIFTKLFYFVDTVLFNYAFTYVYEFKVSVIVSINYFYSNYKKIKEMKMFKFILFLYQFFVKRYDFSSKSFAKKTNFLTLLVV